METTTYHATSSGTYMVAMPPLTTFTNIEGNQTPQPINTELRDYANKMASTLGIVLTSAQILQASQLANKGEVNQFLVQAKTDAQAAVKLLNPVPSEKGSLTKIMGENRELYSLRQSILDKQRQLESINSTQERLWREIEAHREQIAAAEAKTSNCDKFLKAINSVLTKGWYTLHAADFASGKFHLLTPIVQLRHYNEAAGINNTVSLGQFMVTVNRQSNNIRVNRWKDNIEVNGYYHPHVAGDSTVCWGTAQEIYRKVNNKHDDTAWEPSLDALQVILTNYNGGSPYESFEEFVVRTPGFKAETEDFDFAAAGEWFMSDNNIPSDINQDDQIEQILEHYDDDTDEYEDGWRVRLYQSRHKKYGVTLPGDIHKYYYKTTNGKFERVDEEDTYEL